MACTFHTFTNKTTDFPGKILVNSHFVSHVFPDATGGTNIVTKQNLMINVTEKPDFVMKRFLGFDSDDDV